MAATLEAEVKLLDGMTFVGWATSGKGIVLDARKEVGGRGLGPTPMELILIGLAGCTGMDVVSILRKMRQDLRGLEVRVQAERAPEHPKVYTKIHIEYIVRGKNISEKSVKRAIELSETKYCSVSAMLEKTATITTSYRIEEVD